MKSSLKVCCLFIIQIPGWVSENHLPTTAADGCNKLAETRNDLITQTELIKYSVSICPNTDDRMRTQSGSLDHRALP